MGASRKCPDMVGGRMERAAKRGDTGARGPRPPVRRAPPAAFKGLGALGAPRPPPAPPLPAPSSSGAEGAEPESPGHRHRSARTGLTRSAGGLRCSGLRALEIRPPLCLRSPGGPFHPAEARPEL